MQKLLLRSLGLAALSALVIIGGGCSSNNGATSTDNSAAGTTKTTTATTTSAPALNIVEPDEPKEAALSGPAKKPYKIGVSLYTQDDQFYMTLKKGLQEEADKQKVTLDIVSADKDLNKQIGQVDNFIAQKEDAIILCPADSAGIISAIQKANEAKIPVFTADIASDGGTVVSHIASDNVDGGHKAGEFAAKLLNGKGNVAILDQSTVSSVRDRVKGFKDALKGSGIKIVADEDVQDGKRENAMPKATDILQAHPDIDLIFGINDSVALGAVSALDQANNKKVMVVGYDATPEAQNFIASGTSQLKADAMQYPDLIGKTAVDAVIKSLNGDKVPPKIPVPTGLVTQDAFKK